MRSCLKYILCFAAYYSGVNFMYRKLRRDRSLLVLTYHRVVADKDWGKCLSQKGMRVKTSTFARQVKYLARAYRIHSLDDSVSMLRSGDIPSGACSITFDDGWRDVYANGFPVMRRMKIPATVFVATSLVGSTDIFWPEKLTRTILRKGKLDEEELSRLSAVDPECGTLVQSTVLTNSEAERFELIDSLIERLKKLPEQRRVDFIAGTTSRPSRADSAQEPARSIVDWHEIREMRRNRVLFGSHTDTHALLTNIEPEKMKVELEQSKKRLSEELEEDINFFAYPNGDWNEAVKRAVIDAGYLAAFVAENRDNTISTDLFLLGRLNIHEGMSVSPWGRFSRSRFACELSGIFAARP